MDRHFQALAFSGGDLSGSLPSCSLLLADRLYGSPWLLWELRPALAGGQSRFLVRVKENLGAKRVQRLPGGSWLVEVMARDPHTRAPAARSKCGKSARRSLWRESPRRSP